MKILTDIDKAFCAIKSTLPLYDCTDKQPVYYSRRILSTTLGFQRQGRTTVKHAFEQTHTIEICIRIPDIQKCNTQEESESKRVEVLEPALRELRLVISALVMLGYDLIRTGNLSTDIKPSTSHLNIGAKLVATFADCAPYPCNKELIDREKLGLPATLKERLQNLANQNP